MCDLHQAIDGTVSQSFGRAVGTGHLWIEGLQLLQFTQESVVLQVRNGRCRENVIVVIVLTDLIA